MKTYVFSALVVIFVLLASGCSSAEKPSAPTSAPTEAFPLATSVKDLVGTWRNPGSSAYLRFYEDGTLRVAKALDNLDSQPLATFQVQFAGTQISLKEMRALDYFTCGDAPGIYEVRLLPDSKIQLVLIEDKCFRRAGLIALQFDPVH